MDLGEMLIRMDVWSLGKWVVSEDDGRREVEGLFLSRTGYCWLRA